MARIRSIKPDFFTSDTVSALPLRARLTWIGLWTHCDDYGRCRDNVKLIKAAVWPLDDVGLVQIEKDLADLLACGLIFRYEAAGKGYLQVTNWEEHQRVSHPSTSKFPAPDPDRNPPPPSGDPPEDSGDPREDDGEALPGSGTGSREQGAGSRELALAVRPPATFGDFYQAYPRKKGRQDAEKAWRAVVKTGVDPDLLVAAAHRFAEQVRGTDPQYIKYPAGWLRAGSYADEPDPIHPGRSNGKPNADDKWQRLQAMKTGTDDPRMYALPGGSE